MGFELKKNKEVTKLLMMAKLTAQLKQQQHFLNNYSKICDFEPIV